MLVLQQHLCYMRRYNDYELIYMIQSEACEYALKIMFSKYELLIWKYIHMYNVCECDRDDYMQEAKILMYNIINRFDESKGKTFTRFYELVLKRRFFALLRKKPKYELRDDFSQFGAEVNFDADLIIPETLTELEKHVFQRYFIENQRINIIAENNELNPKQVYNAIYRIKEKFKSL